MRVLIAFTLLFSSMMVGQTESEIRDRIVGTWKLVSAEQTMKDGTTRPYPQLGAQGKGFLMYQRDGYMCADQ
jgi:Lipocalin-like domain